MIPLVASSAVDSGLLYRQAGRIYIMHPKLPLFHTEQITLTLNIKHFYTRLSDTKHSTGVKLRETLTLLEYYTVPKDNCLKCHFNLEEKCKTFSTVTDSETLLQRTVPSHSRQYNAGYPRFPFCLIHLIKLVAMDTVYNVQLNSITY